jgi:hypothetical protein
MNRQLVYKCICVSKNAYQRLSSEHFILGMIAILLFNVSILESTGTDQKEESQRVKWLPTWNDNYPDLMRIPKLE